MLSGQSIFLITLVKATNMPRTRATSVSLTPRCERELQKMLEKGMAATRSELLRSLISQAYIKEMEDAKAGTT